MTTGIKPHLRAIIFDFNGVISDDEPLHLEIFRRVLAELGLVLTDADYYEKYLGCDDRRCFHLALADAGLPEPTDIALLIERKAGYYLEAVAAAPRLFPGIIDLIRSLAPRFPLAIASGALRAEIEAVLASAGIRDCFRAVVCSEDVSESKPNPQIFLRALDELNRAIEAQPLQTKIAPQECLVIEDSRSGVEAARRARMRCLAVTTSYPAEALAAADWVIGSLEGFDPGELRENAEYAE